ncbi:MAG: undecaprenyldiphospho-muramoylpentapeptide beta-N-acetylglucosaminyltransferase [Bacteroidales bacterium]
METYKVIISGGGTGGHIFPAISIADKIKERYSDAEILFVGAEGRMEMKRVPAAGYEIKGLPVTGMPRKFSLSFIKFLLNLRRSLRIAKKIVKDFEPDVVVGVGGYASAPLIKAAIHLKVPAVLQEQNSYAGKANRWLAKHADAVCVAYEKMDNYFPPEKIVLTGNPVRKDIVDCVKINKERALDFFRINNQKPVILILGGSLGAKTINDAMLSNISRLSQVYANFIWQCGSRDYTYISNKTRRDGLPLNVKLYEFLDSMDMAYASADVIVSRAGAGTISELCLIGKPTLLVPSPNVAEDHQRKNALALVSKEAAAMVEDEDARNLLINEMVNLASDESKKTRLGANIKKLARPNAVDRIVDIVIEKAKRE